MTAPPILVLGDLVTDVVAHLSEPLATGSDATAAIKIVGGGSGANVAAWLGALGAGVEFIGRIGDDAPGAARAAELHAVGVLTSLAVDPDHATGTVVVIVTPDGERTMVPDRGANLHLTLADIPQQGFRRGHHLHISGYTLLHPGPRVAGLHALELARDRGMTVSVDPSSVAPLLALGPEQFLAWTGGADYCLPNLDEATALTGQTDPEDAADALAQVYGQVVVTLGAEGAVWSDGRRVLRAPAIGAAVLDTTGAGDAFTAGFLLASLEGAAPQERLRRGAELAAHAVGLSGARPPAAGTAGGGYPHPDESFGSE